MGPIASLPIAHGPRRRAVPVLALFALVAGAPAVIYAPCGRAHAPASASDAPDTESLDALARAHRRWVADHGPGCARTAAHLDPYVERPGATDAWGRPLHFECERRAMGRTIDVRVTSAGRDGELGTPDDVVGSDVQVLAAID